MTRPALTGHALTVLGPVPSGELGVTLPHEHLLLDLSFTSREPGGASERAAAEGGLSLGRVYDVAYDWFSSRANLVLDDEGVAVEEALRFARDGGRTLVDPTSVGLRRDPPALRRVARATGLHVIMGAGYYTGPSHPADMDGRTEDALTREIVRDVTEGVGDTGVRAGLVGEIGCSWPWTPNERKSLRAAAEASKATGAPLMIHPGRHPDAPAAHLDEVRRTGLDLRRVILAHVERTVFDRSRLRAIAETGCFVEYDLFGVEISNFAWGGPDMPSDTERLRQIAWLWEAGYGRQVLMAHDICFKIRLQRYGGHGFTHILRHVVPRLRQRGFDAEGVRALIEDNPARAVTFA